MAPCQLKLSEEQVTLVEKYKDIVEQFHLEVCNHGSEVDPNDDYCWHSLSVGFFIARGVDIKDLYDLATIVRYHFEYWESPGCQI